MHILDTSKNFQPFCSSPNIFAGNYKSTFFAVMSGHILQDRRTSFDQPPCCWLFHRFVQLRDARNIHIVRHIFIKISSTRAQPPVVVVIALVVPPMRRPDHSSLPQQGGEGERRLTLPFLPMKKCLAAQHNLNFMNTIFFS